MVSPTPLATRVTLNAIQPLRAQFLAETCFQIRYDACHERGWTDSYLLTLDGVPVGYGSVKGREDVAARDVVFEFFVVRPFRKHASRLFLKLLSASGVRGVECQTNDWLLSSLVLEYATDIRGDVVLFQDDRATEHEVPGIAVRPRREDDEVFPHTVEPVGDYVAVAAGEVVASGGFLRHYNPPFADVFMEVRPDWRGRGIGSLLVQEVKKACYLAGCVPAARCSIRNTASRATLARAGMVPCGFMLSGRIGSVADGPPGAS
jgi:GNAT superfamily N-acetyltransferase